MVGPEQLHPRDVQREPWLEGAEVPGWVLCTPTLGGVAEGCHSLSPTGPSLSFFGPLLVLQHHVGDEHSHKQEQQEAGSQWDGDSIGSGQEVLVDDMLTVDERFALTRWYLGCSGLFPLLDY